MCEYYFYWLKFIAPYHWYFILSPYMPWFLLMASNNTTKLRTYQLGPLWSWATLLNVVTSAGHRLQDSSGKEVLSCCRKIWILSLPKMRWRKNNELLLGSYITNIILEVSVQPSIKIADVIIKANMKQRISSWTYY